MSTAHKTGEPQDAVSHSGTQDILLSRVRRKLSRVAEMHGTVQQSLVLADTDAAMFLKSAIDRQVQMYPDELTHEVLKDCLVEYVNYSQREQLASLGIRMNSGALNNTSSGK